MADEVPQESTDTTPDAASDTSATDDLGDPGKKALEAERAARKEAEKARKAIERELEQLRTASLSESERAVAEAETRGRTAALVEFGQRLARSEYLAEAAKRNPDFDAAAVLEDVNLAKFIGEDGEPDSKAIAASVARLVPAASEQAPTVPSFDGGVRTTHTPSSTADQFAKAMQPFLS